MGTKLYSGADCLRDLGQIALSGSQVLECERKTPIRVDSKCFPALKCEDLVKSLRPGVILCPNSRARVTGQNDKVVIKRVSSFPQFLPLTDWHF